MHLLPTAPMHHRRNLSAFILAILLLSAFRPTSAYAALGDWQKSATIFPYSGSGDFASADFRASLQRLRDINANYVTLVVPFRQGNIHSTDVTRTWNTPTDEAIASAVAAAHGLGMKVNLKIHVYSDDGQWSAYINPGDRETWFRNFLNNALLPTARVAQSTGADEITLGTEMEKMTSAWANGDNTRQWRTMIAAVRAAYSGLLTYSAQHNFPNEKAGIEFWDALDIIGIAGYHESGRGEDDPSVESLRAEWERWNAAELQPIAARYGKPIMFTEIGFKSVNGAHKAPGEWWRGGGPDMQEQVNDYEALFQAFQNVGNFRGIHIWQWYINVNAGGQGDNDYTPQNKPAQQTIARYFGNNTGGGSSSSSSTSSSTSSSSSSSSFSSSSSVSSVPSNTSFTATATAPSTATMGQTVNGTIRAMNTSGNNVGGIAVDIEVFNPSNNRVLQTFSENQSFTAGQARDYTFSWVPTSNGAYKVKAGIFANNWTTLLLWNDDAATVNVGASSSSSSTSTSSSSSSVSSSSSSVSSSSSSSSSSSTAPSFGVLQIWWPSNGSRIAGVQPFKLIMTEADVSQYHAFWQVDGGGWVEMGNSPQDYPHKESLVDVGPWNWRGDEDTYTLTFRITDLAGNEIARTSINIVIVHY